MKTRQYLLFAGQKFSEMGGANDFVGSYDTINDAKAVLSRQDWAHIFDTECSMIVLVGNARGITSDDRSIFEWRLPVTNRS